MNAVPRSGSFLAQEPSTQRPKPSSIVPVAKSSSDGSGGQTEVHLHGHGPGTAPDHVYEASMAWWRYSIRRYLVTNLHFESRWIAEMQKRVRTPWLDAYFVYTSSLGTHTFFMTLLPALYFFGYPETGRAIVQVLAAGVYFCSLVKDLICSPRPFAPPVTRLTMGMHHLEYGFPSTHSTNSVSMALYLYSLLLRHWHLATEQSLPSSTSAAQHLSNHTSAALLHNYEVGSAIVLRPGVFHLATLFLCFYAISIVYGRVYCAMHSFTDCVMGVTLGTAIWAAQWFFGDVFERWMATPGWMVPVVVIFLGAVLVNQHAEPVDDCPCFEDAIAFVSTVIGTTLGQWYAVNWGFDRNSGYFVSKTPGWEGKDLGDWTLWLCFSALKMAVGVAIIFAWRIVAKTTMHFLLPPLFRGLARLFTLPHRRFYTPATDYNGPVPEVEGGFRSIPSVIDIPRMLELEGGDDAASSAVLPRYALAPRSRGGNGTASNGKFGNGFDSTDAAPPTSQSGESSAFLSPPTVHFSEKDPAVHDSKSSQAVRQPAAATAPATKHYDADVITKVVVYAGIGLLGSELIPILFEELGWGVLAASGR